MNEIKATTATWEDIKRLSEENERLTKRLKLAERFISIARMCRLYEHDLKIIENEQIGDLKDE